MPALYAPMSGSLATVTPDEMYSPPSSPQWTMFASRVTSMSSPTATTSLTGPLSTISGGIVRPWRASYACASPLESVSKSSARRSRLPSAFPSTGTSQPLTFSNRTIGNWFWSWNLRSTPVSSKWGSTSCEVFRYDSGNASSTCAMNVRRSFGIAAPLGSGLRSAAVAARKDDLRVVVQHDLRRPEASSDLADLGLVENQETAVTRQDGVADGHRRLVELAVAMGIAGLRRVCHAVLGEAVDSEVEGSGVLLALEL